jgi:hypothetical protein
MVVVAFVPLLIFTSLRRRNFSMFSKGSAFDSSSAGPICLVFACAASLELVQHFDEV